MINHYQTLHIDNFATVEEVKKAFSFLTYQYSIHLSEETKDFYIKAQEALDIAYKTLCSPENKIFYDNDLKVYLGEESPNHLNFVSKIEQLEKEKSLLITKYKEKENAIKELEIKIEEKEKESGLKTPKEATKLISKGLKRITKGFGRRK